MQVNLLFAQGMNLEKVIPIQDSAFCIGRHSSCDLCVTHMAVSRRHAALVRQDGKVLVRDLGSRNGTFVNGELVLDERELRHDDILHLGPLEYLVQMVSVDSHSPEPPVVSAEQEMATDGHFPLSAPSDHTAVEACEGPRTWQLWAAMAACRASA
jgi:predicted component of type VI protein secretion system